MKSTGIIRRLDELGRVVLPMELRKTFNIKERDQIEIFVEGNKIVLVKHEENCAFCGNNKDVIKFKEKNICKKCIKDLEGLK